MSVTIAELNFAPGKAMAPYEDVEAVTIGADGMFGDRSYMWVEAVPHVNVLYRRGETAKTGHFLSLREDPALTQVAPTLEAQGGVTLRMRHTAGALYVPPTEDVAAHRIPVSVWGWHGEGIDQGDEAAQWGAEAIGRPVRLVAVSHEAPRWVEDDPSLGCVGFADGYPVTVGSIDSVGLVNERLNAVGYPPISGKRPRVTILLAGLSLPNCAELPDNVFPEDYVEEIRVGSNGLVAVFRRVKACGRCPVPDTNELTGERRGSPVRKALGELARNGRHADTARYGTKPELFWTQNHVIELPRDMGPNDKIEARKGARVEVVYSETTNWT